MVMTLPAALEGCSHARYSTQDVNFGRFYKAATQTSKRLLKEVFLMLLRRSHGSSDEPWPGTVAEYCFSVLSWSKKRYRESFNAEERALLEQPLTSTDFDVSLLTKIFHKLFSSTDLPESFSRAIRDIKNVRNRVCHEHLVLDVDQLVSNFDDLKAIYRQLLVEASELFRADVDNLLRNVQAEVDGILASPVESETFEYFEGVKKFRAYLVGKFISCGRQELMAHYAKLKILNPFTWLSDDHFQGMLVDKIFTPLHIEEPGRRSINVFSLLTTDCICQETQEATGILPSVVVLSGIAGCGKTSLCRYFLHDWRTSSGKIAALRSVDIVIHIEVRNVADNTLILYLKRSLMLETCSLLEENDIIETLQQMNVLYIVDGMDEAMADGKQLVNQVLSVLGSSRVIITTRPEFTSSIVQTVQRHRLSYTKLSIQGFSKEGMTNFTLQVFSALEPQEEDCHQQDCEFLRFLKKARTSLGDHLKLPLTLVLLISLWREDRSRLSQVTSATRLYSEIFRMCTMKMISRLQTYTSFHQMELEAFTEEWLLALGKEAYGMLENGEYVVSENRRKKLMSLCIARQIDSIQVLSAFLMCEVKENFKGIQYIFSFIHKSQMEYLAAMYLTHEITLVSQSHPEKIAILLEKMFISKSDPKRNNLLIGVPGPIMLQSMEVYKWSNTLKFVIGHLCINESSDLLIREVTEKLLATRSYSCDVSALWQIVQESDCHPVVCDMVSSVVHKFVWQPTNEDLCDPSEPTFQLLQHTGFTPEKVVIRILDSTSEVTVLTGKGRVNRKPNENLAPILACLSRRPSVGVDLGVEQHYYCWGSPAATDDLLTTLLPTGRLTSFMGHVGVAGAAALASVGEVAEAHIRVTDPAALQALGEWPSSSAPEGWVGRVTLRLDLPGAASPSSLPELLGLAPGLAVLLRGVGDDRVPWASEVLARLSLSYREVDFVASRLTPNGGDRLLRSLREKGVRVAERLTVRSVHGLDERRYREMSRMVECRLSWWC